MLRNNVELDLKTKLIEDEMSQTEIADKLGVFAVLCFGSRLYAADYRACAGNR